MIASAASVASAAGLGCLAAGLGCFLQSGLASGRAGWQLAVPQLVFARGEGDKAARQFAREGKGEQSDAAISAGLIHENQFTVCKGTAFSWNKYQKQEENIIFQSFCDLGEAGKTLRAAHLYVLLKGLEWLSCRGSAHGSPI